jgi:hypothetical protein
LDVQLDSVVQNVDSLGMHLPRLRHLRLSNSSIISIRELGTALSNLEVLWMSRCGLQEIDGITVISELQELYLPFNDIADVSQLKWLDGLSVLDLEGNALSTLEDVDELRGCHQLRDLTLQGNPVCALPQFTSASVLEMLPQLEFLDGLSREEAVAVSHESGKPAAVDPSIFLDMYLDSDLPLYLDLYLGDLGQLPEENGSGSASALSEAAQLSSQSESTAGWRRASHPLFEQGLQESAGKAREGDAREPTEQQLILERVKRVTPSSKAPQSFSQPARASTPRSSGFNLQLPSRRQAEATTSTPRGQGSSSGVGTPRGQGSSSGGMGAVGLGLDDLMGQHGDAASDLTCGVQLAGNPLSALRQRRNQASSKSSSSEVDVSVSIRELMRRHRG